MSSIMDQYINQTQTLHDLAGARSFVFLTVPPIQLSPMVLAQGSDTVTAEGKAVEQYNAALKARVEKFAKANAGVRVAVVDTTKPFMEAISNPKAYGAENATCFDESGTKCLWWNDVSSVLFCFWGGGRRLIFMTVSPWTRYSSACC
jgi:phospholipase/lecithinase/hemolysin